MRAGLEFYRSVKSAFYWMTAIMAEEVALFVSAARGCGYLSRHTFKMEWKLLLLQPTSALLMYIYVPLYPY